MNIIWGKIKILLRYYSANGAIATAGYSFHMVINKVYSRLILGNAHLIFDYTAKVEGAHNIEAHGAVTAGRHLWIAAIEHYGNQVMNPRIVFKGNFSASDFCHIGATNYIEFGDNVLLGSKVYITDHQHGRYSGERQSSPDTPPGERELTTDKSVIIGDNVWVGDNVVILPGVTIGSGCVIGANSVVSKSIPDNCIAVGVPARVIKRYEFEMQEWVAAAELE